MIRIGAAVLVAAIISGCGAEPVRLVLGAGTTLVDSGVIDLVVADYESDHPEVTISVVGEATGRILALARNQAVDLTLTHAPEVEEDFIAEGGAAAEGVVFRSQFVLIGPDDLVRELEGLDLPGAFTRIATEGLTFVSRADGSGTHETERRMWEMAGIDPTGADWYLETGQGMGLTLQVTSQRRGFTLSELGSFLVASADLGLVDSGIAGPFLDNPYRLIVVEGGPHVAEATAFYEWMRSEIGQTAVANAQRQVFGPRTVLRPPG